MKPWEKPWIRRCRGLWVRAHRRLQRIGHLLDVAETSGWMKKTLWGKEGGSGL
jgi:hypothetical protein